MTLYKKTHDSISKKTMSAKILDGKKIAGEIKLEIKQETERLRSERGIVPGLAFILVGENPAAQSYVTMKEKACEELGFHSFTERFSEDSPEELIVERISLLNADPKIHGILVQLPLPNHNLEERIVNALDYRKDIDGVHPMNAGRLVAGLECFKPCTPLGVHELLLRTGNNPSGKHVVIAGRSNVVGKPLMNMLLQKQENANATVTIVHTGTNNIPSFTMQADILIVAMGKPKIVTGDMIKPGAVVIDVGINHIDDPKAKNGYRIVGDVHFASAVEVASAISPVPGGVGPMTIAMLMRNTLQSAKRKVE